MESVHEKGPFLCSCKLVLESAFHAVTRRRIKLWSNEIADIRDFNLRSAVTVKGVSLCNLLNIYQLLGRIRCLQVATSHKGDIFKFWLLQDLIFPHTLRTIKVQGVGMELCHFG